MRLMRPIVTAALATLPMLLSAARTDAQALADQVRGDAIGYVGWAGADALGPRYDKSHLKAVLEASSMPQFLDDFVPRLIVREDGDLQFSNVVFGLMASDAGNEGTREANHGFGSGDASSSRELTV